MLTGSTLSGHLRTDTAMISTSHFPQKHRNLRKECAEKKSNRKPPTNWMLLCLSRTRHKKNTWNSNNGIPGIFFGNGRRFYRGFEEGYHFFTWWGGEESDVVFTTIFHFDTFSIILPTTIS